MMHGQKNIKLFYNEFTYLRTFLYITHTWGLTPELHQH